MNSNYSCVGKKMVMALTGGILVLFLLGHLAGNSLIFAGPEAINAYGEKLHSLPVMIWVARLVLLAVFGLHVYFGIALTLESRKAKGDKYAVQKHLKANVASKTMIWTGLAILVFLGYHLAHYTLKILPGVIQQIDDSGRFDVFFMVVGSFLQMSNIILYGAAMAAVLLHLFHGIQSVFQTLGLNSDALVLCYRKAGRAVAVVLSLGFLSIPVWVLFGIMRG